MIVSKPRLTMEGLSIILDFGVIGNTEDFGPSVMGSSPVSPTIVQKNSLWIGDSRRGMKRDSRSLLTSATVGSIPTCTTF